MPCSRKQALCRLFSTLITILKFLFLFFYFFSLFLAKLFTFFFSRSEDEYEDGSLFEDEEEEEELDQEEEYQQEEEMEDEMIQAVDDEVVEDEFRYSQANKHNHLVADIVHGGESLIFTSEMLDQSEGNSNNIAHVHTRSYDSSTFEDTVESFDDTAVFVEDCSSSDFEQDHSDHDDVGVATDYEVVKEAYTTQSERTDDENHYHYDNNNNSENQQNAECQSQNWHGVTEQKGMPQKTTVTVELSERDGSELRFEDNKRESNEREIEVVTEDGNNFTRDEKFLIFDPPRSESKKFQALEKDEFQSFEDTYTIGSTSKSSSEWRSSIPDSGTDDPFSSSSRRSCPKWESYTVYQKYDEEMMFLDKISAQKLHETESLRSILVEPRSISQRIVHKLANKQRTTEYVYKNSYNELESAYVAQICLAWEALNWNYANFRRKQASRTEHDDRGCPAYIAQQFQQFQVLLQRYIENEPYERGRRPEIYARMRTEAPKLLQVPEYHDYEGEHKEEAQKARIASASFLLILEEAIRTFMSFLKADRTTHSQVLTSLFKRRPKALSVDPAILHVVKKQNKKTKLKLKELQRSCICFRKRKIGRDEEMEILMSLIDLEVVTRVMRMTCLTEQQLKWCEDKMRKVRLLEGKFHRDSSPLFFPAH